MTVGRRLALLAAVAHDRGWLTAVGGLKCRQFRAMPRVAVLHRPAGAWGTCSGNGSGFDPIGRAA
jgi:hypothetical protein